MAILLLNGYFLSFTYCLSYESNHAPDALDSMKNGIKPKRTDCPEHEQAATAQRW